MTPAPVNEVLNQGKKVNTPVQTIEEAITQNEDVEHKVAKAADDLHQVNTELAKEVAERVVIESELADTKTDLAERARRFIEIPGQRGRNTKNCAS